MEEPRKEKIARSGPGRPAWKTALPALVLTLFGAHLVHAADRIAFDRDVRPLLAKHCLACHGPDAEAREGDLRLDTQAGAYAVTSSGRQAVAPGQPDRSEILRRIRHADPEERMPPPATERTISPEEIATIERWIREGARWENHWAFRPLTPPPIPDTFKDPWCNTPVDAFLLAQQRRNNLQPSAPADRATQLKRLAITLTGLPPSAEDIATFVADPDPDAYDRWVEHYLASPRYGERWARHWLDIVKYADTHGYDKDKIRPNAWPYRDYVIRAFNDDKPYPRFVQEQIAGDHIAPADPESIRALGFLAAGPWDFIGHAEVPESKIDGQVARNLDRDEMVSNTLNTFSSLTIQCARCHDHKFDPLSQEDYYNLHTLFAWSDRADRDVPLLPETRRELAHVSREITTLTAQQSEANQRRARRAGPRLAELDTAIQQTNKASTSASPKEHGWHSKAAATPLVEKWVQVDLGQPKPFTAVTLIACDDDFGNIGAGFGFPLRFRVEASNDPAFMQGVTLLADRQQADVPSPGITPMILNHPETTHRYVRVTATKLFHRVDQYIFALAELKIQNGGQNAVTTNTPVTASDTIHAPPRWRRKNLVDRLYPIVDDKDLSQTIADLRKERDALILKAESDAERHERSQRDQRITTLKKRRTSLETSSGKVYAATVHKGSGAFRGRAGLGPRTIHVLRRGEVTQPLAEARPALPALFNPTHALPDLDAQSEDAQRRGALAAWIVDPANPLTWRSIVNRVWSHHFGQGLVDSPNDFGRMGQQPTHPELLDWLALRFRDVPSFKSLHRLIVTSAAFRQKSTHHDASARIDADNRLLWRMNRRRLDAESVRDATLLASGKLDLTMYGPGFRSFALEKNVHSPQYLYHKHDPNDVRTHRRTIYRFVPRSQPEPLLSALDCADPTQSTPQRAESLTPLQALALRNNRFVLAASQWLADAAEAESADLSEQVSLSYLRVVGQAADEETRTALIDHARVHGLANTNRILFNLNAFLYVD